MKGIIGFLAGGVIGSVVTYMICKSKTKELLNAQALELHEYYTSKKQEEEEKPEEKREIPNKPELISKYNEIKTDYTTHNPADIKVEVVKPEPKKQTAGTFGPYPISFDEFGENGYEAMPTWNHYCNGFLIDANGNELSTEDISRTVGLDYRELFGDPDGDYDTLYIRNEELQCDFEIYNNGEEEYFPPSVNAHVDD